MLLPRPPANRKLLRLHLIHRLFQKPLFLSSQPLKQTHFFPRARLALLRPRLAHVHKFLAQIAIFGSRFVPPSAPFKPLVRCYLGPGPPPAPAAGPGPLVWVGIETVRPKRRLLARQRVYFALAAALAVFDFDPGHLLLRAASRMLERLLDSRGLSEVSGRRPGA